MLPTLLGGLGCFLLGMGLMTDGLESIGGSALRRGLARFTGRTSSAVLTGIVATALVQSSSATTLTAIGLVRAGLLPLVGAVGVIYGANVGTTATSWIVAGLGLEVDIGMIAMPLVGIGALARLIGRGRWSVVGSSVAGFGLIFVGIELMKSAMGGAAGIFDPTMIGGGTFVARALLVLLGAVMTIVMQSSSAAIATTLAAVHMGALGLVDAAAMVIGQNVGTTVTAVMGAAGGSVPARRAALAHVLFNVGTAFVAFLLLPMLGFAAENAWATEKPALALATFHTVFNFVGILIFLPLTSQMIAALERLVPDRAAALTRRLQERGPTMRSVELVAARRTATEIAAAAVALAENAVTDAVPDPPPRFGAADVETALTRTLEHLGKAHTDPSSGESFERHVSTLHAVDHLRDLMGTLSEQQNANHARQIPELAAALETLAETLRAAAAWAADDLEGDAPDIEGVSHQIADLRRSARAELLAAAAAGRHDVESAERALEAYWWLDRLAYHVWRAFAHLALAKQGAIGAQSEDAGRDRELGLKRDDST